MSGDSEHSLYDIGGIANTFEALQNACWGVTTDVSGRLGARPQVDEAVLHLHINYVDKKIVARAVVQPSEGPCLCCC